MWKDRREQVHFSQLWLCLDTPASLDPAWFTAILNMEEPMLYVQPDNTDYVSLNRIPLLPKLKLTTIR